MMMHADGELNASETQELMNFLYEHPELQSELTAFSMARMVPEHVVYAAKEGLLQPEEVVVAPRIIAVPVWRKYAIAAGVALLLGAGGYSVYNRGNMINGGEQIAVVENRTNMPTVTNAQKVTNMPVESDTKEVAPSVAAVVRESGVEEVRQIKKPVRKPQHINAPKVQPAHMVAAVASKTTVPNVANTRIEELPLLDVATMGTHGTQKQIVPVEALLVRMEVAPVDNSSFIDKLPIVDTKKEGMREFASALARGYSKINNVKSDLSTTKISVSVEDNGLVVSF